MSAGPEPLHEPGSQGEPPVIGQPRAVQDAGEQDIDDLLSVIANAQERIANEHAARRTVLITDMMSFSEMTEQDGSINSALLVQKHRDLLLPVIARHGGKGKAAGGDGILAAFEKSDAAIACAIDIQRTLASYNAAHEKSRSIVVRVGLATGEIVLDREGVPFIGSALNLAARVMSLAEGGRIFSAADVVDGTSFALDAVSQGSFSLKGIPAPTEVSEILWHGGQVPGVAQAPTPKESDRASLKRAKEADIRTQWEKNKEQGFGRFYLKTGLPWAAAMFVANGIMDNSLFNSPAEKLAIRAAIWLVAGVGFGGLLWLMGTLKSR